MGYLSKVSDIVDTEMRSKSEGFTLIELMIVVAIIAILAAISVPDFMSYRNKARIASTVSTMGQVRGAMASYASSYLGNPFPPDDAITDWNSLASCHCWQCPWSNPQGDRRRSGHCFYQL
jgi:type IV pilus assembly protein PilA